MPSTIQAGNTASSGLVTTGHTDGILELRSGTAVGGTVAMTVSAGGVASFAQQPVVPVQSMVRLNTANGYGSTNTAIRRFSTVVTNQGADITYADSATLGATFTINISGVYAISYSDQFNAASNLGISLNSSQLGTVVFSISAGSRLIIGLAQGGGEAAAVGATAFLNAGDVIRAHAQVVPSGSNPDRTHFTIVRVS